MWNKLGTETSVVFAFKDPSASYDYNSNDADPAPRPTWNDENRSVIVTIHGLQRGSNIIVLQLRQ